ncbi:hypothetical protein AB1K89_05635 [Sporosarcina sp. 179-K 8C2 HS]|uniref:hypothetical protein n=1 Tax=Sporosarcina sp. 179-K 8C2 HS TaxID=3142387 RepID=UPI0039A3142B
MKKLFILLIFFLLSACQMNKSDLTFVGESENWLAEVTVLQTKGEETYQIQLTNKGINVEEIDAIHYYVESKNNGVINFGENDVTLNQEGKYDNKSLSSNFPSTTSNDELVIKIDWNDTSESFDLRSK